MPLSNKHKKEVKDLKGKVNKYKKQNRRFKDMIQTLKMKTKRLKGGKKHVYAVNDNDDMEQLQHMHNSQQSSPILLTSEEMTASRRPMTRGRM